MKNEIAMLDLTRALAYLRDLGRDDLALLLRHASARIDIEEFEEVYLESIDIQVRSPFPIVDALLILNENEKSRIIEAILRTDDQLVNVELTFPTLRFLRTTAQVSYDSACAVADLRYRWHLMLEVATGKQRIDEVNDHYRTCNRRLRQHFASVEIVENESFDDLWAWYQKWKADFPSYASRRDFLRELHDPLIETLVSNPPPGISIREPTGWQRVDRGLSKARRALDAASDEEDFQAIGLLCREILISLGQAVYDPEQHTSPDGVQPGDTDAKRMLEAFLAATVSGGSNEAVRAHAKAALRLALELQHKRTATAKDAALCLEATSSAVNVIAILADRRT